MTLPLNLNSEWLEPDGLGGFASGTVGGPRSRRYHALLLHASTPPTGRRVLVNGIDAWIETDQGSYPITSQYYAPGVLHPDGQKRLEAFHSDPWPRWSFLLEDGRRIEQQILVCNDSPTVILTWQIIGQSRNVVLKVRPFLSGRDYHSLHHENPSFNFAAEVAGKAVRWRPYRDVPAITAWSTGRYQHEPAWYRNFLYAEERERGLDFTEDLASPGTFVLDMGLGIAALVFSAEENTIQEDLEPWIQRVQRKETTRRSAFASRLERAADTYIVKRASGKTIIAGYPWFTDWGRDTFIALRGLCLATGRLGIARGILLEWAGTVSRGMLPNRFPDQGGEPEYNSVDASLWYVIAVHEYLQRLGDDISAEELNTLLSAVEAIVSGYASGTRYGIRMDADGLLACGEPGVQLTWMDAKVGDWVVTPRIGKPVEVEALWLNALWIAAQNKDEWKSAYLRGCDSFRARFWNPDSNFLYDVVDVDHQAGKNDPAFRPNQILAVGGLPIAILNGGSAKAVVEAVEHRLLTPLGLRSLAPGEPDYTPRYAGGVRERDGSYHQGTVWPWLIGPFVEAWVRAHGDTAEARQEARLRFLNPLLQQLDSAGVGHLPEIADADSPHSPRGCPFQAWSVGEALRLSLSVLAP